MERLRKGLKRTTHPLADTAVALHNLVRVGLIDGLGLDSHGHVSAVTAPGIDLSALEFFCRQLSLMSGRLVGLAQSGTIKAISLSAIASSHHIL